MFHFEINVIKLGGTMDKCAAVFALNRRDCLWPIASIYDTSVPFYLEFCCFAAIGSLSNHA